MSTENINKLFPVFLKLENFRVLIVGGGKVGLEKVTAVLNNSPATKVTLIATNISDDIKKFSLGHSNLIIKQRPFQNADLENIDLVIVAVNNKETSIHIKEEAQKRNILANVADTPEQCDFYLGSIVQKGDLKIAISTNGKSPTIAKRVREVFEESFPDEMQEVLENLYKIRTQLNGDFSTKVSELNKITANLSAKPIAKNSLLKRIRVATLYSFAVILTMIFGHLVLTYVPFNDLASFVSLTFQSFDPNIWIYILAGFIAQMIDGALGMAYGVTATTFLLSGGISPAASSASVHASEIFTSGVSGLMHLKFGNVNKKLFKSLLIPGVIGAILGAYVLTSLEDYNFIIKPLVSFYTLVLGVIIIYKALKKDSIRKRIKRIFPLAFFGGLLDSIGGGGWGPIVSSTLIARGRNARYTIGSVNLTEFFVALASSLTFVTLIGLTHWMIIAGLIIGGSIAAPIGAIIANKIPTKTIMILVGLVVIIISLKRIFF